MTRHKPPVIKTVDQVVVAGFVIEVPAKPWCDCRPQGWGYTKRADGCWVRPCCMRRERQAFEKHGNNPVPPARITQPTGTESVPERKA